MGISGVDSNMNSIYQSMSQIRLQEALAKNTRYQESIHPVDKANKVTTSDGTAGAVFKNNSMDFLRSYSGAMSDVMESANSLRSANSTNVLKDLTAVSSDTKVAEVSERYPSRTESDMTLKVNQLAAGQQNVSAGVDGSLKAAEDMDFVIAGGGGRADIQVNALNDDGSSKTNRDMIKEAAKKINESDAGVTATVLEKDGVTTLQLQGKGTGTSSSFNVAGDVGALAGVKDVAAAAQNAEYSVTTGNTTRNYTAQSNKITLDTGKMNVTLKSAGEAKIGFQADNDKIVSAVEDLLKSYNEATTYLAANADHGIGVQNQLSRFESSLLADSSMDRLGISKNKDGTLALDKEKLTKSLNDEPGITKQLLSGSNGLAQNMFQKAEGAMSANSASLISNDIQEIDQMASSMDSFQFMNLFSRSGAFNMNNFVALGMMVNYLA